MSKEFAWEDIEERFTAMTFEEKNAVKIKAIIADWLFNNPDKLRMMVTCTTGSKPGHFTISLELGSCGDYRFKGPRGTGGGYDMLAFLEQNTLKGELINV